MLLGHVCKIEPLCRWGFIECAGFRRPVWFHANELLLDELSDALLGARVSFELSYSDRGQEAVNVTLEESLAE